MKKFAIIFLFILLPIFSHSTIIEIPYDYTTIQEGINAAIDTDTILVQPGTYFENINYNGKNITVASLFLTTQDSTYIAMTIIDGGEPLDPDDGACVTFKNEEDSTAVLSGFTIINGSGTQVQIPGGHGYYYITLGGGICCNNSNPSIENIQISGNYSEYGGGIGCMDCSPSFKKISIINNVADSGGGLYCTSSNPNLENVDIFGNCVNENGGGICNNFSAPNLENVNIIDNLALNRGGGIYYEWHSSFYPNLTNVYILNNSSAFEGGGIHIYGHGGQSFMKMKNVLISGNYAEQAGGGIRVLHSELSMINCTISENISTQGGGIYVDAGQNSICFIELINCISGYNEPQEMYCHYGNSIITISLSYSDIYGDIEINTGTVNWLGGCFIQDPFFSGSGDHPFSLQEDSPCMDAGTPDTGGLNLPPWDIIGNHRIWDGNEDGEARIDMGAYEYGAPSFTEANDPTIPNSSLLIHNLKNYPNPFNPTTVISYQLSADSDLEDVELSIYNIKGQQIKQYSIFNNQSSIVWDGTDDNNQSVSSGIYFYKLRTEDFERTKKMILMK